MFRRGRGRGGGVLANRDPLFSILEGWFNREGGYSCGKMRYDVQRRLASSHFQRRPRKTHKADVHGLAKLDYMLIIHPMSIIMLQTEI